jgi:hypothetical protein
MRLAQAIEAPASKKPANAAESPQVRIHKTSLIAVQVLIAKAKNEQKGQKRSGKQRSNMIDSLLRPKTGVFQCPHWCHQFW